jgi:small basic protein
MYETRKQSRMIPFLIGIVLGVLGSVYLPGLARPYLPVWLLGKTIVVKGNVTAKQKKADALLLTVNTAEGVLLATFNRKLDEVNLLVNETDTIELAVPKYLPFVDEPKIVRVTKEAQAAPEPAASASRPTATGGRGGKPGEQKKLSAAAPAPATSPTGTRPAAVPAPRTTGTAT